MSGFSENVSFVDDVSPDGIVTTLHFEGDDLITQHTYDAEPHLRYAQIAREATDGMRWGEGRLIAHIPPAEYARFLTIQDNKERRKAIMEWLRPRTQLHMFHRAFVTPMKAGA